MNRKNGGSTINDRELIVSAKGGLVRRKFRQPRHGKGLLLTGNPGLRPNKWRAFCVWLADHPDVQQGIERALRADPVANQALLMFIVEQGHGRARQQVELSGREGVPIELAAVRESLVKKIAGALPTPQ